MSDLHEAAEYAQRHDLLPFRLAAGRAAFDRALRLGYCRTVADQFRRTARREAQDWESSEETALRIVRPMPARVTGVPNGAA